MSHGSDLLVRKKSCLIALPNAALLCVGIGSVACMMFSPLDGLVCAERAKERAEFRVELQCSFVWSLKARQEW